MTPGVEAAVAVAEEYGLRGVEPIVLQDTNNTVVWLSPVGCQKSVARADQHIRH